MIDDLYPAKDSAGRVIAGDALLTNSPEGYPLREAASDKPVSIQT
jgi:hypothetical protein